MSKLFYVLKKILISFQNGFKKVLISLQGKKTTIATILTLILVFSLNREYIAKDVGTLIAGIMVALGLTANIVGAKVLKK